MGRKAENLTGQKFNKLTVIKRVENYISPKGQVHSQWLCECKCGNEIIVSSGGLKSGNTKSCGCLNIEKIIQRNKILKKKYNIYNISGDYGIGYTNKGEEFYFDLEDYDLIKDYCWCVNSDGYIICTINKFNKNLLFHRHITSCPKNKEIDHINGIRNDNRKINLRICEHQENMCNYKKPIDNTSGVKGISYCNTYNAWRAYIG